MASDDITVEILRDIRAEMRGMRDEVRATNVRLDATNEPLDAHIRATNEGFAEVNRKLVESEIRTSTAITALDGTLTDVRDLLRDRLDLRDRVERFEQDIASSRSGVDSDQ